MKKVESSDSSQRAPAILVVEDEFLVRIVLSDYLQECGFKVLEAASADEAIELLETNHFAVDVVFSDIQMPGSMDGFRLAHWIRSHRPGLPVLLTSGDKMKTEMAKELCESEPFLEKPYDLSAAVAVIRAMLDARNDN